MFAYHFCKLFREINIWYIFGYSCINKLIKRIIQLNSTKIPLKYSNVLLLQINFISQSTFRLLASEPCYLFPLKLQVYFMYMTKRLSGLNHVSAFLLLHLKIGILAFLAVKKRLSCKPLFLQGVLHLGQVFSLRCNFMKYTIYIVDHGIPRSLWC